MDKYYGEWLPYSGTNAIFLGINLLVISASLFFFGLMLKKPLKAKVPGKANAFFLIILWSLSILTFFVNYTVYMFLWKEANLKGTIPKNPMTIFTIIFAVISFLTVFFLNKKRGFKVSFFSATICVMVGSMLFELPFDLILIRQMYPPIPPRPMLFQRLFFLPLFMTEISTIALTTLSPLMKITKYTLYSLGGMFLIFSVWGFFGFSFPYTPGFLIFNISSKAMAFIAAITLFLPEKLRLKNV